MPNDFPKLPFRLGDGGNWCEGFREQGEMSFSPKMAVTKGNKSKKSGSGKSPKKMGKEKY